MYRAHHPKWSYQPVSGDGAKRHGGRFNPPGLAALYLSLDPTTAWMEAQQGFPFKPQPMTLVAYQVDCLQIADLTDRQLLRDLDFPSQQLGCAWEDMAGLGQLPPTWQLAEQLLRQQVAGILVPSFAPGCGEQNRNLVLWDWSDQSPHEVRVIDDFGRLPTTADSWPDG